MPRHILFVLLAVLIPTMATAGNAHAKEGAQGRDVKTMSEKEQRELALLAAPAHIAKEAGIMVFGADGKLTEIKKSTNGFTCIPSVMQLSTPDPMCMDEATHQWMNDMMSHAPKPTNTVPGIAYMAHGGAHFEKDGSIVMSPDGAKTVMEPAHWMIMWPFDAATTKLPTMPNSSGTYIMFDGTPYAHLMVYQDPRTMK